MTRIAASLFLTWCIVDVVSAEWITPDAKQLLQACSAKPPVLSYQIKNTFPHDTQAFTQGLAIHEGRLYEGTGRRGQSDLREVDLTSGRVLRRVRLPKQYFGEGLVVFNGQLVQLTWREGRGLIYGIENFVPQGDFEYRGEGWGITHDGQYLLMSDGEPALRVVNPKTYLEERRIKVTDARRPVRGLNELEFVDGFVLANIWRADRIAMISPKSGRVCAWVHLAGLLEEQERRAADVLNGIAYDAAAERLFVTGKLWPKLFEILVTVTP